MIDREARQRLARLLKQLVMGKITNDEFEDRLPGISRDKSIQAISGAAWYLYDDLHEHRLIDKQALSKVQRREIAKWILFLRSEREYTYGILKSGRFWAIISMVIYVLLNLITYGTWHSIVMLFSILSSWYRDFKSLVFGKRSQWIKGNKKIWILGHLKVNRI